MLPSVLLVLAISTVSVLLLLTIKIFTSELHCYVIQVYIRITVYFCNYNISVTLNEFVKASINVSYITCIRLISNRIC